MKRFLISSIAFSFICAFATADEAQQNKQQINEKQQAQQEEVAPIPAPESQQFEQEEPGVLPEQGEANSDDPRWWNPRYPRPHYAYYRCIARDRGWEEHFRGHMAEGYNYNHVYFRALNECRRYHGACNIYCQRLY